MLLMALILVTLLMPQAVMYFASADVVNGAIIAGVFSIVNTYLNARILRQVGATKKAARAGSDALLEIADIRSEDKPSNGGNGEMK